VSLQLEYNRLLAVRVAESSRQVFVTAQGRGEEPRLEFSTSVLELGPCQPISIDVEAEVTVKNPCSFPVEFYSLEFDTQYLKEERVPCLVTCFYLIYPTIGEIFSLNFFSPHNFSFIPCCVLLRAWFPSLSPRLPPL